MTLNSPHIETPRLHLDTLAVKDQNFILELLNTPGFIEFIGDRQVRTVLDAETYVTKIIGDPSITYWIVRLKEDTQAIGIVSLIKRDYLPHRDIGFAFLPQFGNQGYALEAATAVLENFMHTDADSKILANPFPENLKSIQLLTRLGLRFECEMEAENETKNRGRRCHIYGLSKDQFLINDATRKFYEVFLTTQGQAPDWQALHQLCLPTVRFTNKNDLGFVAANLDEFVAPRKIKLADGTLVNFEEFEIQSETKIIQHIAQRYSRYEKRGILNEREFQQRGEKLLQFVKIDDAWKINSVLWEDEAAVQLVS